MPRVLICDPNPETTKVLRWVLESEGFEVVEAGNTEAARYQIIMNSPDFVLIDWLEFDIAKLDIKNFCQQVKRIRPNTTFIFMAHKGAQTDLSAFAATVTERGADDYLLKPLNPDKVVARLESWLQKVAH